MIIGTELITYSSVSGNTLSGLTRGANGTTAAIHSSGAVVTEAAGYAGWGAHQLDTELSSGAWFTVFSDPGDLWSKAPDDLYEQVLRRQTGDMRWFANAPLDPKQN